MNFLEILLCYYYCNARNTLSNEQYQIQNVGIILAYFTVLIIKTKGKYGIMLQFSRVCKNI